MQNLTVAPREIPPDLLDSYTLCGEIPVIDWYIDQASAGNVASQWHTSYLNDFIARFTPANISSGSHGKETYPGSALMFVNAFNKYNVECKRVAVIGSETPWVEALLLNMGNHVTTVEYNLPKCEDSRIVFYSYQDFESEKNIESFDAIVSYSSTEHSGLGRYGDSLDPWGDIRAMAAIYRRLKPEGILFWGGPVGSDALVWNAHRIYGKKRLPLLFSRYTDVEWLGFEKESLLEGSDLKSYPAQPVVVLRPKHEVKV